MQSGSLVFLFTVIIAVPIIALSSNHEIFFAAMSLIIAVTSVRTLYKQFTGESLQASETDEDLEGDLEDLTGIDVKRFGKGLSMTVNLIVILYLLYCAFFLDTIILKAITSFAIILQVYFMIKKMQKSIAVFSPDRHKPQFFLSSISNIAVVIFTVINKLQKLQ